MLTESQLRQIMPNLPATKAALFLPHLNLAMSECAIDSMLRTAAFVAQLAHESGEFRWMEEIWGPTDAQRRYEPVSDLSRRLGNAQPGDGKRFKGRGPIQLTGRANYQRFSQLLGVDLLATPEQAAAPEVAFRVAALYWKSRGLNELADAEDFREITRRINGGFNGHADRQKYFERAKAVLATGFEAGARATSRAATRGTAPVPDLPVEPLTRGFEAIRELTAPTKRATRSTAEKAPARTTRAKKAPAKKAAAKKAAPRKGTAQPSAAQKTKAGKQPAAAGAAKRGESAKAPARKASARKPSARKAPAKKESAAKRAAARRR